MVSCKYFTVFCFVLLSVAFYACDSQTKDTEKINAYLSKQVEILSDQSSQYHFWAVERYYQLDPRMNEEQHFEALEIQQKADSVIAAIEALSHEQRLVVYRSFVHDVFEGIDTNHREHFIDTMAISGLSEEAQLSMIKLQVNLLRQGMIRYYASQLGSDGGFSRLAIGKDHSFIHEDSSEVTIYLTSPKGYSPTYNMIGDNAVLVLKDILVKRNGKEVKAPANFIMNTTFGRIDLGIEGRGKYHIHADFDYLMQDTTVAIKYVDSLIVE